MWKQLNPSTEEGHCSLPLKQRLESTEVNWFYSKYSQGQDAESNPSDLWSDTLNVKPWIPLVSLRHICFYFCLFLLPFPRPISKVKTRLSLNHLFSENSVQNPIYVGTDPKSYWYPSILRVTLWLPRQPHSSTSCIAQSFLWILGTKDTCHSLPPRDSFFIMS